MTEVNRVEEEMPAPAGAFKPGTPATASGKPPADERPAWLPSKFKGGEDLAKSYSDAERELAAAKAELAAFKAPKPAPQTPPADQKPGEQKPATEQQTPAGIKGITPDALSRYNQEVSAVGELSPASYAELAALGIPKEMVDSYIAGQGAIKGAVISEAHAIVGGEDQYNAMREWAASNIPAAEAKVIDAAFNSGSKEQILWAVKGLAAQWRAATSQEPSTLVSGSPQASHGIPPFRSQAEMVAAIRSPLYRQDGAYREMIAQRISASNF